jgi:Tfp pilus assembly protein FimV
MDLDGQLIIEWDRASRPIQRARRATFEIVDGAERQTIEMAGERLREGSLTYARRADRVDVWCRVELPAASVEEFVRFIGQPPPTRPSFEQAETLRQRDELQQQVERLRAELALKDAQLRRLQQRASQPPASAPSAPPR